MWVARRDSIWGTGYENRRDRLGHGELVTWFERGVCDNNEMDSLVGHRGGGMVDGVTVNAS